MTQLDSLSVFINQDLTEDKTKELSKKAKIMTTDLQCFKHTKQSKEKSRANQALLENWTQDS